MLVSPRLAKARLVLSNRGSLTNQHQANLELLSNSSLALISIYIGDYGIYLNTLLCKPFRTSALDGNWHVLEGVIKDKTVAFSSIALNNGARTGYTRAFDSAGDRLVLHPGHSIHFERTRRELNSNPLRLARDPPREH